MAITGNGYGNTLNGSGYGDEIFGYGGDDQLNGFEGNDTLYGGSGNDTMAGGNGDDLFIVDASGDVTSDETFGGAGGTDTVESSATYSLSAGIENLVLTGDGAISGYGNDLANHLTGNGEANYLDGGLLNDTLDGGGGNDTLDGSTDDDSMIGGYGDDLFIVNTVLDSVTEGFDQGNDTIQSGVGYMLADNVENLVLVGEAINGYGNDLDNSIAGNDVGNYLEGRDGDDTLDGYGGDDTLVGGDGNDLYHVFGRADTVIESANSGDDTVNSIFSYRLGANIENLQIASGTGTGNALANMIFSEGDGQPVRLVGLGGNDTLLANSEVGWNDVLLGGGGNDSLEGYGGDDTMIGGAGNDTYSVDSDDDQVVESTGHGTDTVKSSDNYTLGANVENLVLTGEALFGMGNDGANAIAGNEVDNVLGGGLGNDTLLGGSGNDILDGSDGNDSLDGAYGEDLMIGGAGDDVYGVDDTDDITVEEVGEGTDKVVSSVTWTLDADVENLQLDGAEGAFLTGTGNELKNTITGDDHVNTLNGAGGADTMIGGKGNDTYVVNAGGDVITEGSIEGSGFDQVFATASYTLGANVENLILDGSGNINGTGNAGANAIIGNSGANQLTGGNGHDTLVGGDGADSFRYAGALANAHSDTITDFTHGTDHIDLDDALFTAIGAVGNLAAGAFKSATNITATGGNTVDASDRILYDSDSGNVYYDADGSGAGARVLIFTLSEHPTLTATDIRVI